MKRRRWDSKTKTKIVLEGLSGRPVSEICNEYGIHQNQFYIWRDKFLSDAHKAFDSKKDSSEIVYCSPFVEKELSCYFPPTHTLNFLS